MTTTPSPRFRLITLCVLLIAALTSTAAPATEAANKELVRAYFDMLNRQALAQAGDYVTDGFGADRVAREEGVRRSVFPDLRYHVEELYADGDTVIAVFRVKGKQSVASDYGPATNKSLDAREVGIYRLEGGKIAESSHVGNLVPVYQALDFSIAAPE